MLILPLHNVIVTIPFLWQLGPDIGLRCQTNLNFRQTTYIHSTIKKNDFPSNQTHEILQIMSEHLCLY